MFISPAFAQGSLFGGAGGDGGMIMSLLPFVLIFVIMYFLILRPQQKRVKQHAEMVKNVRRGDTVVTNGGLIGKITDITEAAGAEVQAIYPIGKPEDINPQPNHRKKVIIRFHCPDTRNVVKALESAGFPVLESVQAVH